MRVALVIAVVGACSDRASPPAPTPVLRDAAIVDAAAPRPRGPEEIDGSGVGPLALGIRARDLPGLGWTLDEPKGHASFTQDGKNVATTVRMGSTATLRKDGVDQIEVQIEPAQIAVDEIIVRGPRVKTAEGIGVGATLDELTATYGQPSDSYDRFAHGECRQYAKRPGVDFCIFNGRVQKLVIPALRASPLAIGEDLAAIEAAIEGHVIFGGTYHAGRIEPNVGGQPWQAKLVAACTMSVRDHRGTTRAPVMVRDRRVYTGNGGWRRPDGGFVLCEGDIYEIAADGGAIRWQLTWGDRWRVEPAVCKVNGDRIDCRGTTGLGFFRGRIVGDLVEWGDTSEPLAERRAFRADGTPIDDCDRRATKAWEAVVPTLSFLGIAIDAPTRLRYLDSSSVHRFIGECVTASDPSKVDPPHLDWKQFSPEPAAAPAPPRARQRTWIRELAGTWRRSLGRYGERHWRITAAGELFVDGKPEGPISFTSAHQLWAKTPRAETGHMIVRDGKDRFYADDRRILCPADLVNANLDREWDDILIRGDVCKTITPRGELRDATCHRDGQTLRVTYVDHVQTRHDLVFRIVDGCYVESAVEPFERVRPS